MSAPRVRAVDALGDPVIRCRLGLHDWREVTRECKFMRDGVLELLECGREGCRATRWPR